ncbi:MAG: type IV pili methyl-accepting chemotaxis transducer N-terminal domain-containing protein [Rhodocyclaceae bacterium]|nr:type IV pili methyl-accepting chemotaxis transducer N-terminal domain-containing protein [Rhodocyclaceae bacterium]
MRFTLRDRKLSDKIIGMLVIFFLVALAAIGMTLRVSWQLEGAAAAINDGGSERMRSYRIAYLLARRGAPGVDVSGLMKEVEAEVAEFDRVLTDLERGDPLRPLFIPRDEAIRANIQRVRASWTQRIRPMVMALVNTSESIHRERLSAAYNKEVRDFVADINNLVLKMEVSYAHNTNVLRSLQAGLVVLALIGTVILISFFQMLVIRPVRGLQEGMGRMAGDDFGVRLEVRDRDEFGELAEGFNRMAAHLESLYATLEDRVESKTRSLEQKNRELGLLYEIAACLNEPASIDALCREYLRRVKHAVGADAASVRLFVTNTDELYLLVHEGLSETFVRDEAVVKAGQCVCGEAIRHSVPMLCSVDNPPRGATMANCIRAGFHTVTAFAVSHNRRSVGQFNLYFKTPRIFNRQETLLLETLGQHLGLAVENQRLVMREREMAISEERNLLAQELHDSIAQGLAFLNIQVQLLGDSLRREEIAEAEGVLAQIREGVQESYEDVRELLVHFRTRVIQNDLEGTIRMALKKFEGQTGIATELQIEGDGVLLPPGAEVQILHIVQESLSNIRKHASAHKVCVDVKRSHTGLVLTIGDDGVGFDPENDPSANSDHHVGLQIMKERCQRIGGDVVVHSRRDRGTQVVVTLPGLQKESA